jgi:Tfp pilus assembly protein PilV
MTLLEVLVACGILVIGLASLASLLPAAGSRLAQASLEDRVGVAATNAYAELANRGLIASDLFISGSKACVFGMVIPGAAAMTTASNSIATSSTNTALRIDITRGFVLEDDLTFTTSGTSDTPMNSFLLSGTGPREYKDGVCWGAMLAPASLPAISGGPALLSIAVFKKDGASQLLTLTATSGMFIYSTGANNGLADEATRKAMLPGCSYVLALPSAPATTRADWFRITSSWTNPGPGTPEDATKRKSYVVIDFGQPGSSPYVTVSSLNVVAFEGLMRVDKYSVLLD